MIFLFEQIINLMRFVVHVLVVGLPGILSVKPDEDFSSVKKDYRFSSVQSGSTLLFPLGNTKHWLVRMDKPGIGVVTKAQMVDYYVQILTKVLGK
jgi:hypothetical protein